MLGESGKVSIRISRSRRGGVIAWEGESLRQNEKETRVEGEII